MKKAPDKPGPGRPKGSKNKITLSMKEAFIAAYESIGGEDALAEWAKQNQTEFYKICARMIPANVEGSIQHEHTHEHRAVSEIDRRIGELLGERATGDSQETVTH